jgi:GNAT superfamily N-acetyltransferase
MKNVRRATPAFGYLSDVFVAPEARGQGLGKELAATMIARGPGARFRWACTPRTRTASTASSASPTQTTGTWSPAS